jgi:hypothetical protein
LDIGLGQPGVGVKKLILSHAFAELAQEQLDRDARTGDDWFAKHDIRVDLNAVKNYLILPCGPWTSLAPYRTPAAGQAR